MRPFEACIRTICIVTLILCHSSLAHSNRDFFPRVGQFAMVERPTVHVLKTNDKAASSAPSKFTKRAFHEKRSLNDVRPDDVFHMRLTAYNQTFSLILEPNYDLIHPEAQIQTRQKDGTIKTKPLLPKDVGVYRGYVISPSSAREGRIERILSSLHTGRDFSFNTLGSGARITLFKDQFGDVGMDGNFFYRGETYHLKYTDTYKNSRSPDDPMLYRRSSLPEHLRSSNTLIYRRSDMYTPSGGNNVSDRRLQPRKQGLGFGKQFTTCANERFKTGNHTQKQLDQFTLGGQFHEVEHEPWWRRTQKDLAFDKRQDSGTCISGKKVLYMGVAADCTYVAKYGSEDKARTQILSNWNQASSVYERQIGVQLGVVKMQMEDASCPTSPDTSTAWNRGCSDTYTIEDRLNDFSSWRGNQKDDGLGLWHLMTRCASGPEVGLAWTGTLCQTGANKQSNGVGSGTGVSAVNLAEWKIVAHEIGHNFGAVHDCTDRTCGGSGGDCCKCGNECDCKGKYIMNPTNPVSTDDFSPCSISAICQGAQAGMECLSDPGSRTVLGEAMCGNGIKEDGEDCDCGTSDECEKDPCCDHKTCKYKNGAQCSDFNDMCCSNCKVHPQGTVCRKKNSDCDVEEVCDGKTGDCPDDKHVDDGSSCGDGLQCASGQCTNRDLQCKERGGSMGIDKHCPLNMVADPCKFQCASPESSMSCYFLSGSFLDGTECGWHAKCREGKCKGDNAFYELSNLYRSHLPIAIPVTIVCVIALALIITALMRFCCGCFQSLSFAAFRRGSARRPKLGRAVPVVHQPSGTSPQFNQPPGGDTGFSHLDSNAALPQMAHQYPPPQYPQNGYGAPPSTHHDNYNGGGNGPHQSWVDPSPYNGNARNMHY